MSEHKAELFVVRALIERAFPDERHEQWMARVLLGATYPTREGVPEVLAVSKRAGRDGFSSRVELWAPKAERAEEDSAYATVQSFMLRPSWARKGWGLADGGYLRRGGDAHDLLHSLFIGAAKRVGLDPWGDDRSPDRCWLVRDHLPLFRVTHA